MDDILELLLTIILLPFRSKRERIKSKLNGIENKALRVTVKILIMTISILLIFGLTGLCSYMLYIQRLLVLIYTEKP